MLALYVRSMNGGRQRLDCNCPEEGSELGIPSHTALSRSALAEVLLAVLKAQSSLTPSGDESGSAAHDTLIKAMGPHNLENQMQYTQLNTRAVDSLDVRGIP